MDEQEEEVFAWLLPEDVGEQTTDKEKQERKSSGHIRGLVLFFAAILVGVTFGLGLLQLMESPKKAVKTVEVTLSQLEMYVLQHGVFQEMEKAEKLVAQLQQEGTPAVIIEGAVLTAVTNQKERLPTKSNVYKKQLILPEITVQTTPTEGKRQQLMRELLAMLISGSEASQNVAKQLQALGSSKKSEPLYNALFTAYKEKTQQTLLNCIQLAQKEEVS